MVSESNELTSRRSWQPWGQFHQHFMQAFTRVDPKSAQICKCQVISHFCAFWDLHA